VAGLAGAVLVSVISRAITGPLETLVGAVRSLAAGDYAYSVVPSGGVETMELASAFNRMRQELMNSQKLQLESERMAALGRTAGAISHDLRHHLAALVANAEFLYDADAIGVDREEVYQEIERASAQMTGLLDSLVEIARERKTLTVSHADLQIVIRRAIDAVRSGPEFHGRIIDVISDACTMGEFDAPKLERVFFNLLLNSCQATDVVEGRIEVTVSCQGGSFECRVKDTGTGIAEAIRETLFEPFVSAGKTNGTGLGLAIAARIIHDHGGSIRVEETSMMGTTFLVCIPQHCVAGSVTSNNNSSVTSDIHSDPDATNANV
jgi:signal transduction histidine kinase